MVDLDIRGLASTIDAPPYEVYDRMRDEPVRWDDSREGWVVTSYDLCKQVLRGDTTFCRHINLDNREVVAKVIGAPRHLNFLMGEDHRRIHQWWLRLFSPTQVEPYRESVVKPIVAATVDRFADLGQVDLIADFAGRIPVRVVAGVMGMSWA
jgi:cytochrome P450